MSMDLFRYNEAVYYQFFFDLESTLDVFGYLI
jgi:hypothetical protein